MPIAASSGSSFRKISAASSASPSAVCRPTTARPRRSDQRGVTFKWKDYRVKADAKGQTRHKTMTLAPEEFMRRFLLHVLPGGFHRIRHFGLLANGARKTSLALVRELLHIIPVAAALARTDGQAGELPTTAPPAFVCRHCGHATLILQTFMRGESIRAPPGPGCTP